MPILSTSVQSSLYLLILLKNLSQVDVLSGEVNVVEPASRGTFKKSQIQAVRPIGFRHPKNLRFQTKPNFQYPGQQLSTFRWLDHALTDNGSRVTAV